MSTLWRFSVPWRYVHPQTDHVTFRPTPYIHPTFCPLWQFSTATLRPCDIFLLWHSDSVTIFYCDTSTMWHFATVTFRLCDNFLLWHFDLVTFCYCDILTLWQFSTVTFHLKVDGLFVHPKKWTFCHTVTFRPTVILANPWLWHFVHFGFPFLPSIPCPSCCRFWQMTISWHYPFNFWTSTHWFGRLRPGRGYAKGVFFRLFFRSDRSFGSYGDF